MNKILLFLLVPCVLAFVLVQAQYGYGGAGSYAGGYGGMGGYSPYGGGASAYGQYYAAQQLSRRRENYINPLGVMATILGLTWLYFYTNLSKTTAG